jgi:hypothetical protein
MAWIRGFVWGDENVAHIARHGVWPGEVEEALVGQPLAVRGLRATPRRSGQGPHGSRHDRQGKAFRSPQTKGMTMKTRRTIPAFRSDREAAEYWAKHDSAAYAKQLPTVAVKASPALRRRAAARAKKPVTLRLEEGQIAAAKRAAERMSIPYQTLLRMWIAERLAKERVG